VGGYDFFLVNFLTRKGKRVQNENVKEISTGDLNKRNYICITHFFLMQFLTQDGE
jgi:hypothetical protein